MHRNATVLLPLLMTLCRLVGAADTGAEACHVTKLHDSLVDPAVLTIVGGFGQCINDLSFQQDAVTSHAGW